MANRKARPNFLNSIYQIASMVAMDFRAKEEGMNQGVAFICIEKHGEQGGDISFHYVDSSRPRRPRLSSESLHSIDYFGEAMMALKEAMKHYYYGESRPGNFVEISFPGSVVIADVGGYTAYIGFAGGTPKENQAIAEFGLYMLQIQIEKTE